MRDEGLEGVEDFAEFDGYEAATAVNSVTEAQVDSVTEAQVDSVTEAQVDSVDVVDQLRAPSTGNARVDAATARLDALDELGTAEHADVFEDVHRQLQGALADLDGG